MSRGELLEDFWTVLSDKTVFLISNLFRILTANSPVSNDLHSIISLLFRSLLRLRSATGQLFFSVSFFSILNATSSWHFLRTTNFLNFVTNLLCSIRLSRSQISDERRERACLPRSTRYLCGYGPTALALLHQQLAQHLLDRSVNV